MVLRVVTKLLSGKRMSSRIVLGPFLVLSRASAESESRGKGREDFAISVGP